MTSALSLWDRWCEAHNVLKDSSPLFQCDENGRVLTRSVGNASPRPILCRHPDMDARILQQTEILTADWQSKTHEYDGIIYVMFTEGQNNNVLPLYIGKAETFGKGDGNLSVNLHRLATDRSKFARWGDNYQYHIGDLSAAALHGHQSDKISPKYERWAETLFEDRPAENPRLRLQPRFWAKAWKSSDVGVWSEMNPTKLTFLEYLLIGVASAAFGTQLLNTEGRNR